MILHLTVDECREELGEFIAEGCRASEMVHDDMFERVKGSGSYRMFLNCLVLGIFRFSEDVFPEGSADSGISSSWPFGAEGFQRAAESESENILVMRSAVRVSDYAYGALRAVLYLGADVAVRDIYDALSGDCSSNYSSAVNVAVAWAKGILDAAFEIAKLPKLGKDEHCVFIKACKNAARKTFSADELKGWFDSGRAGRKACDIPIKRYWSCEFRAKLAECEFPENDAERCREILESLTSKGFLERESGEGAYAVAKNCLVKVGEAA